MQNREILNFLKQQADTAQYVTSEGYKVQTRAIMFGGDEKPKMR